MVSFSFSPLGEKEFLDLVKLQNQLGILQGGAIRKNINIFKAYRPNQHGGSIFSILANLGKRALPFLSNYIFPSAKNFAKNLMSDVMSGENLKKSLKQRGSQGLREVGDKILSGSGRRRIIKRRKRKQIKSSKMKKSVFGRGKRKGHVRKKIPKKMKKTKQGGRKKLPRKNKKCRKVYKRTFKRKPCKTKTRDIFS